MNFFGPKHISAEDGTATPLLSEPDELTRAEYLSEHLVTHLDQHAVVGCQLSPELQLNGLVDRSTHTSHCHSSEVTSNDQVKVRKKMIMASILCLIFLVLELTGGFLANSLAILTDAAHLLSDFAAFLISLLALQLSDRRATKRFSFGWHRAEVMGALVSILLLWLLTGILVFEATQRILKMDFKVNSKVMLITSSIGIVINIILGVVLHGRHGHSHGPDSHHSQGEKENANANINMKAAMVHVIGDLIQSVGVFIAALFIYFKPTWSLADPICTLFFSVLVLVTTIYVLRDVLLVLMEASPKDTDFTLILDFLKNIPGVQMVHNLHLWSLTVGTTALSAHLVVVEEADPHAIVQEASRALKSKHGIRFVTIQTEKYVTEMEFCTHCQELID